MIPEDILQDGFGVDEIGAEDLVEGGDGATEVFGNQVRGRTGREGETGICERRSRISERLVVADIGDKSRIRVRNQVRFQGR